MGFDADLRKAKKELEDKVSKIFTLTTVDVMNAVVLMSPVDTGRFRSNWQPTVNAPATGELPISSSLPAIAALLGETTLQDIMYLTNNLAYAETLVDNPTPRWVERETYKAKDYMRKHIEQVDKQ